MIAYINIQADTILILQNITNMKKYYEIFRNSNLTATLLLYLAVILITVESIKRGRKKLW